MSGQIIYDNIDGVIRGLLAFVMFSIGLSLRFAHFKEILRYPLPIFAGLVMQMLLVPALCLGIGYFYPISTEWKVGFIILALCPGGSTASFIAYWFKGNVALSISLTILNSLLCLFSIPLITNFALWLYLSQDGHHLSLPFADTVMEIFVVTLIPAALGLCFRAWREDWAEALQKPLKILTLLLLGLIFSIKIGGSKHSLSLLDTLELLPITLILNALGLFLGYYIAKALKLSTAQSLTIGVEMGIHNTSLAFLVTDALLHNLEMSKPALVYAIYSFWTAVAFAWWVQRRQGQHFQ